MRVLWTHNFDPRLRSSGVFMHVLAGSMRDAGVDIQMHYTGSLRNPARLPQAVRAVRDAARGCDLIHAQFGSACSWVTSFAPGPKALSLRGSDLLGIDTGGLKWRLHGRLARQMTRASLRSYERVFVMSHRMRRELATHHDRRHGVEVLPDGIDLGRFRPLDRSEARQQLGHAGEDRPWVVFASLMSTNRIKRPELARAAVSRAAERLPGLTLKPVHGVSHDEVALWMAAADVLLLTSTREGWPNVIKEALACNTPFVATDVSDLADIADQESSCHVTAADPDALAEALLGAIASGKPTTLRRHVTPMDHTAIASRLRSAYRDLLGTPLAAAA